MPSIGVATISKNSRFQMGHHLQTNPSKTTTRISKRCSRNHVEDGERVAQHSRNSCQSCTGRVIADCIAVCCCPCAILNLFTLTFVKLPWMIGRKCLDNKRKKKKLKNADYDIAIGNGQGVNVDSGDDITTIEEEQGSCKYSARFEAERVWLELYKVDHLGFGRVSFSGIQSLG